MIRATCTVDDTICVCGECVPCGRREVLAAIDEVSQGLTVAALGADELGETTTAHECRQAVVLACELLHRLRDEVSR